MKNSRDRRVIEVDGCPICGYWNESDYPDDGESVRYVTRPVLCLRCEYENREDICTRCGEYKPDDVEGRYSFGVYAGRLCSACARTYADHCGLDGYEQGDPKDLDEPYDEEV